MIRSIIDHKLRSAPNMATPEMQQYQLVAALDWIKQFQAEHVVPSYSLYMHHALPNASIGTSTAHLPHANRTLTLTATAGSTIGDHLQTERGIAEAMMVGVNRPAYVATALWAALMPGLPSAEVDPRLARIFTAFDAIAAAPAPTTPPAPTATPDPHAKHAKHAKHPKPHAAHVAPVAQLDEATLTQKLAGAPADHNDAAQDATAALRELKALLWPAAGGVAEAQLIVRYRAEAMRIYNVMDGKDAKEYHREDRLVTVELVDWDAVEAAKASQP